MKTLSDLLAACAWVALSCVALSTCTCSRRLLSVAHSVVMFNSTTTERWPFPRYFEYNIVRGPGNARVEWIRVYIPGQWQPVAESTLGPAADDRLLIVSGAGSTTLKCTGLVTAREALLRTPSPCRSPMRPFTHGNIVTGTPEGSNDSGIPPSIARPVFPSGSPDLMYAGLSSSSASSVSDGG